MTFEQLMQSLSYILNEIVQMADWERTEKVPASCDFISDLKSIIDSVKP